MGSQDDIRQKLLGKFREVTADRVEKISAGLLALERGQAGEAAAEIARELHTLKGEARMLGLGGLAQVIHAAEDVLRATPSGPSGSRLQALLETCDAVPPLLDGPPDGGETARVLTERLQTIAAEPLSAATEGSLPLSPALSPPGGGARETGPGPAAAPVSPTLSPTGGGVGAEPPPRSRRSRRPLASASESAEGAAAGRERGQRREFREAWLVTPPW